MKKIRTFVILTIFLLLTLLSISLSGPILFLNPVATPLPKGKASVLALESQVGHSDGILILGVLIFIFTVVPIIIKYRNLHAKS